MRKTFPARAGIAALAVLFCFCLASAALAAPAERWIHIKVDDSTKGELVRVNVPLSFAEKVLPTINHGELREGSRQQSADGERRSEPAEFNTQC